MEHLRPRTWFTLSESGRTAFARYRATLHEILDQPEPAMTAPSHSAAGAAARREGDGVVIAKVRHREDAQASVHVLHGAAERVDRS